MRDELCHGGTSQRFEKGCSSGDGSPEQCRRPRYNGRVSGPRFHHCMGFGQRPAGSTPCTCCVFLHPSHLRFPLRCPLTDTLTLADGTTESSQRTMYSSTSPASAHTHTWQVWVWADAGEVLEYIVLWDDSVVPSARVKVSVNGQRRGNLKCEGWRKTQHVQGVEPAGRCPNPIQW